ncbi:MAG: tRNA (adenine(22)-N(1))-methyltransferase [Peptoniphilaceae bacterium]
MNLSNRLKKIANYVDIGSKVADIGTDHGFVPNFLVDNNISRYIVASDISKNSLSKTIELIEKTGKNKYIFPRVGNGLNILNKGEVDTIIVAGMGGELIKHILLDDIEIVKNLKKLILQPMQGSDILRKFLYEFGFNIIDESIIYEDDRYFEIIVAKYDNIENKKVDEIYYEIPEKLYIKKDKILNDYINFKILYNKNILNKLYELEADERIRQRINYLEEKNKTYKEMLWNIE